MTVHISNITEENIIHGISKTEFTSEKYNEQQTIPVGTREIIVEFICKSVMNVKNGESMLRQLVYGEVWLYF